ncbi:MAG TPA: DJ-1/PfpI family protein [Bacillota bacterium]
MAAKRILMVVGDFVEDYEAFFSFQALEMVGHTVHAASPGKRAGEKVKTAVHDSEGDQSFSEKPGHNFTLNATFEGLRPEDYDALVIPGGRSPEYLRLNPAVLKAVRHFAEAGKPIAAICHAAQILATAGVLAGRSCTCYPSVGPDIELVGANYVEMPWDRAMVDGNLVTAPGWGALGEWISKFLAILGTRISA